jgi:endonuclease/exonuclease/phosphatase family metal-dependent hydrolase
VPASKRPVNRSESHPCRLLAQDCAMRKPAPSLAGCFLGGAPPYRLRGLSAYGKMDVLVLLWLPTMADASPTNPTTPYGPLIETQIRIVTWNLWSRLGDWKVRAEAIAALVELRPDLVCLQEVWQEGDLNQVALLAEQLGMVYAFACDRVEGGIDQGVALLCRWPLTDVETRPLPVPPGIDQLNVALRAVVDGPRGPLLAVVTHLTPYPTRSEYRQQQVRAVVEFMAERKRQPATCILCGDFNAAPDADEIRLLTGRRAPCRGGLGVSRRVGDRGDGSPGYTMAKRNPNAADETYGGPF